MLMMAPSEAPQAPKTRIAGCGAGILVKPATPASIMPNEVKNKTRHKLARTFE